jgi:prephenate dehydrogenase
MIERLAIIGVGLIGGSLARALRAAGAVNEVVGCGRALPNLERAVEIGVIDRFDQDPAAAVAGADLVFIAVPLGAIRAVFTAIKDRLRADAIVTDGGSVKGSVVADALAAFGRIPPRLVPGHPIAGTEHSGVDASFATLYRQRRVILTPLPETDPEALARVDWMWRTCGAEVSRMSVAHHDEVLAATSHLPHMLAYGLVDALARSKTSSRVLPSPRRIAWDKSVNSMLKRASMADRASRLAMQMSRHMTGLDEAMRVKSRKPPAA